MNKDDIIKQSIDQLAAPLGNLAPHFNDNGAELPSVDALRQIMLLLRGVIFPGFFSEAHAENAVHRYLLGLNVNRINALLSSEILKAFMLVGTQSNDLEALSAQTCTEFIAKLPAVRNVLLTDVQAMFDNDPAATGKPEVILCYPAVHALVHHRVAHTLLELGVPLLPRIIAEMAHSATGIDIHPGAKIGSYFSIDHGTGVVIGETCVIGDHVSIYQGVTLGAKNFSLDANGHPINTPRHPIIEDYVTIYSNATVLGRITIGHNSIIGGNIWLTHSLPPNSRLLQRRPVEGPYINGAGI